MSEIKRRLVDWGFFLSIGFASFAMWTVVLYDPTPPHRIISADLLTPIVFVGDEIKVRADIERTRACASEIRRFWLDADTREVIVREEVPGGSAPIGRTTVTSVIDIPARIDRPGRFIYRAHIVNECGARTYLSIVPDMAFKVVP